MAENPSGCSTTDPVPPPALPSATLVLLRNGPADLEVLLLRRGSRLSAFAGAWVFPGGAMEPGDDQGNGGRSFRTAARCTAVRELKEETGLTVDPAALVPLSRWTAPLIMPRRFDTWFFLAGAPRDRVRIDGGEIHDHRWISPATALDEHSAGRLSLFPPTWITLHHLQAFQRWDAAIAHAARHPPFHYAPKVVKAGADTCFLYGGDQAYGHLRLDGPGPRHRLWVRQDGWYYERTP